jgi:hypothetical protein
VIFDIFGLTFYLYNNSKLMSQTANKTSNHSISIHEEDILSILEVKLRDFCVINFTNVNLEIQNNYTDIENN